MTSTEQTSRLALPRRGLVLEWATRGWNVIGIAVLAGLALNAGLGWWRADPIAGYVLVGYATREVWEISRTHPPKQRTDSISSGYSDESPDRHH